HVSDGDPLTPLGLTIASSVWLSKAVALSSLSIETFYIVALFNRRARPYIGTIGVLFFVGIRALMGPTFETYLVCGLFLVPWDRVEQRARAWFDLDETSRTDRTSGRPVSTIDHAAPAFLVPQDRI